MSGNRAPQTPTFKDALDNFARDLGYRLFTHLPATIVSYDRAAQQASVQIQWLKVLPSYAVPIGYLTQPYAPLTHVPVLFFGTGAANVGGDPAPGDFCTLVVMDRDMTMVKTNPPGTPAAAPPSDRSHDLSDCVVLMGPMAGATTRAAGEFGIAESGLAPATGAKVVVMDGLVSIANKTKNLETILQNLITGILALQVSGVPVTDVSGQVTAAAADLAALLY